MRLSIQIFACSSAMVLAASSVEHRSLCIVRKYVISFVCSPTDSRHWDESHVGGTTRVNDGVTFVDCCLFHLIPGVCDEPRENLDSYSFRIASHTIIFLCRKPDKKYPSLISKACLVSYREPCLRPEAWKQTQNGRTLQGAFYPVGCPPGPRQH